MYKIKLEVNGKVQKVEGKSALSAIKKLKNPGKFTTKGTLKAKLDEKEYEFMLPIIRVKRLFMNDIFKISMAKNIDLMLK